MDPIRGSSAYNVQSSSSASPADATQAAGTHPSGYAEALTPGMLSDHTVSALNAKEVHGNEQEKMLAGFAKGAIGSGQLQRSPDQPVHGDAQFGMRCNEDFLVIKARLNDQSKYDVLSLGFRRGSGAPVSMTLPGPSTAAAHNTRLVPTLLGLPTELLLQIAGGTGERGEGVDLSMRRVSRQMKDIADDQMSSRQSFLALNGQALDAVGYSREDMNELAARPAAEQDFVLAHAQQLRAAHYNHVDDISTLARRPAAEQQFVLNNAQRLRALGYHGYDINALAARPAAERDFVLAHGRTLQMAGYDFGSKINQLAAQPAAEREFVLTHAQQLHQAGYVDGVHISALAGRSAAEKQFVFDNAKSLEAIGYGGSSMNELAARPAVEQDFVLTHGAQLRANGYIYPYDINDLAARPDQRNAFLEQIGHRS